jgi:hypothetical protein
MTRHVLLIGAALIGGLWLTGCAAKHQIQTLVGPSKRLSLVVDYETGAFSPTSANVSVQAKGQEGLPIASFRHVQSINVAWLDPEDVAICEIGDVADHKTHIVVPGPSGGQDVFVQYKCPLI